MNLRTILGKLRQPTLQCVIVIIKFNVETVPAR
jgi:hypothetical protein